MHISDLPFAIIDLEWADKEYDEKGQPLHPNP